VKFILYKLKMRKILFILIFAFAGVCNASSIYVSPNGHDGWDGSIRSPFKTIERARNEARKIKDHVTVYLRGGEYQISKTIVFNIEDGNVTYKAYGNEKPIITSGIPVRNWEKCVSYPKGTVAAAKGNLWVTDIPEGITDFKVLFDGNHRLKRAHSTGFQTPKIKFKSLATRNVAEEKDFDLLRKLPFPNEEIKNWSNLKDVEVFFCGVPWTQNIVPLEKVDEKNNIAWLKFAGNTPPSTTPKPYNPTYIENSIDVLDVPGEWCVNTKTRKIYYWPINGTPSKNIAAPTLIEFFRIEGEIDYNGSTDVPVKNINFKGLTFTKGDRYSWWKGHKGYGIQHDWDKFDYGNALLRFRGAENCKVSECSFINSGNSAIRLDLHAQNITIENSLIDRVGHMGILLCGYGPGTKDVNKNNKIVNNLIRRTGEVIWHGHAIFVWQSGDNYIANNHIRESPRKAIGICGVRGAIFQNGKEKYWDEAAKTIRWNELKYQKYTRGGGTQEKILPYLHSRNNLVENNYVYRTRTKIGDGASMNVSGAGTGNTMRRNMLYMALGNGMRCDDWQNGTVFEDNLILSGGIVHKGKNDVVNNILLNSTIRFSFYPDQQPNPGSKIEHNIFYFTRNIEKPYTERIDKKGYATPKSCDMKNNLYYNTSGTTKLEEFITKQEVSGIEKGAMVAVPGFLQAINLDKELKPSDFELKNNAEALRLGIKPIEVDKIGLKKSYPKHLLGIVFPEVKGTLISSSAKITTNAKSVKGNLQDLVKLKESLKPVIEINGESTPYITLKLEKVYPISGVKVIADSKDRANSMRGLAVWASLDGKEWQELWRADPYHIGMGRDWLVKPYEISDAKYIRVGLLPREEIQLADHDDRAKDLNRKKFYLNSILVYTP